MAFIVANTGEQIKAKFDGAIYNTFAQNKDYIIKDIGEEFECLYEGGSLDIQVGTGQAIIGGRTIVAEESNSLTLPSNSTIYLCLRVDLSQVEGQVGMLYANTSSEIEQDNLNDDSSAIRDLLLAIVETDSNGITNVEDKRLIKDSASSDIITENTLFNISGNEFKIVKVDDAIKLSNNVKVNSQSLELVGIDVNNIIASGSVNTYTAIQDCWVYIRGYVGTASNTEELKIDDVAINYKRDGGQFPSFAVFVKKGQTILLTNVNTCNYTVFGLK